MERSSGTRRLPLFPLPHLVHFPGTELRLHIFEPRYRQMVRDLLEVSSEDRLIGMLLAKPPGLDPDGPGFFQPGTAGRVVDVEYLPDGRSDLVLVGQYSFRVEREVEGRPYRQGLVVPTVEPPIDEDSREVRGLRRQLVDSLFELSRHVTDEAEALEVPPETDELGFELLVNRIADSVDLPPLRKLALLDAKTPERAQALLSHLRGRLDLLEMLQSFRHLSENPEVN